MASLNTQLLRCAAFFVIQRAKSTPHSSEFARLELEAFNKAIGKVDNPGIAVALLQRHPGMPCQ